MVTSPLPVSLVTPPWPCPSAATAAAARANSQAEVGKEGAILSLRAPRRRRGRRTGAFCLVRAIPPRWIRTAADQAVRRRPNHDGSARSSLWESGPAKVVPGAPAGSMLRLKCAAESAGCIRHPTYPCRQLCHGSTFPLRDPC